jgi:hypothetical protein
MRTDPNVSTWIEWESILDLNDRSGHQHVAKARPGLRQPPDRDGQASRRRLRLPGGRGRARQGRRHRPGGPGGPATQDRAVRGPAVRWRAEYVPAQGRQVLVVVVDPPRTATRSTPCAPGMAS